MRAFRKPLARAGALGLMILAGTLSIHAAEETTKMFDINDVGKSREGVERIQPWRVIDIDKDFGGQWMVAGDIDGDGQVEIVTAKNMDVKDVHYTSAVAAQKLDGTVLWTWGNPEIGRKTWSHDVACQIYDWDDDGHNEVIVATKGFVVELDGATGKERRRLPIPADASDCLVFCNLSGGPRATDLLVKTRYEQIWALNHEGETLWTCKEPGSYRTAHRPLPLDLDGDGRDEIFAGYGVLNSDGTLRWVLKSEKTDLKRGHLDCTRVVRRGAKPEDWRIAQTCCGANDLVMVDGAGNTIWEVTGHHFESINVGRVLPGQTEPDLLVDIDHTSRDACPLWLVDAQGRQQGQIISEYCRHHRLLDWDGDGLDEIFLGQCRTIFRGDGSVMAVLDAPGIEERDPKIEVSVIKGDMDGDGVCDINIVTPERVYIYRNESDKRPEEAIPLGTGTNVTLY